MELLRLRAITQLLRPKATVAAAIAELGFVQADPIRSPATAQDLILRHRVKGYTVGDLDRRYASSNLEEDYLYAYGFLERSTREVLQPRKSRALTKLEKRVLAVVRELGDAHPRELEAHLGKKRVVNAWGGYSKATTHALDALHYRGHLRVVRRDSGTRVYATTPSFVAMPPAERLRRLILLMARVLAPVPVRTLRRCIARYRTLNEPRKVLADLLREGTLREHASYVWPSAMKFAEEAPPVVRLLAPFDPVVWDRERFVHLWGWRYRFEAYTPISKRIRGYYAMPMLWRDRVVGWANASVDNERLRVAVGFERRPRDAAFRTELDAEIHRLATFLGVSLCKVHA